MVGLMDNEKETKSRLLECAMKEFTEKGYMKASLRNICKCAGVTTGALYFFFKDKEDLFGHLVGEPLGELKEILEHHFNDEIEVVRGLSIDNMKVSDIASAEGYDDDIEVAKTVVHFLFSNKAAFDLLLTKSQGSCYENITDQIVELVEEHYVLLYVAMKGYHSTRELTKQDRFIIHWMSHDQIDVFVHILTHCKHEREALKQMHKMMAYLVGGWYAVIESDE